MRTDRILLFIPSYNCAPQIGRVLGQVRGEIAEHIDEILVLDNGSRDGTIAASLSGARGMPVPTKVALNRDNYNLGGSHKAAFAYAAENGFTHVVTLHGDDQGNVADLLPVLRSGDHRRFDACLGSRFMRAASLQSYSALRVVGNRVFNALFSIAARRGVTDLGSGLNIFARTVFGDERLRRLPDDLTFNAYFLLDMIGSGRAVHFFPISWREDDQVSNVKMASQALETLRAPLLYMFKRKSFGTRDFRLTPRDEYMFDLVE